MNRADAIRRDIATILRMAGAPRRVQTAVEEHLVQMKSTDLAWLRREIVADVGARGKDFWARVVRCAAATQTGARHGLYGRTVVDIDEGCCGRDWARRGLRG